MIDKAFIREAAREASAMAEAACGVVEIRMDAKLAMAPHGAILAMLANERGNLAVHVFAAMVQSLWAIEEAVERAGAEKTLAVMQSMRQGGGLPSRAEFEATE